MFAYCQAFVRFGTNSLIKDDQKLPQSTESQWCADEKWFDVKLVGPMFSASALVNMLRSYVVTGSCPEFQLT